MADNTQLNTNSTAGDIIATDDIGGVKHQRVKIQQGADGSATDVSSVAPLEVTLENTGANSTALTVDGSAVTQPISGEVSIGAATTAAGDLAKAEDAIHSSGDVGVMPLSVRSDALAATSADGDYTAFHSDIDGQLKTVAQSKISTANSTTTPLGISGVFTGTSEDISNYSAINITVFTDEASVANGLSLEWSSDGTNWDHVQTHSVLASTSFVLQAMGESNFFRVVYTNGATGQTVFRLKVIYKATPSLGEVQQLDELVADASDAQLVRSILAARKPDTTYTNIEATTGGNLKVSLEEVDAGASLDVTNSGTFAVQEDGAALTALQLLDDVVATDGAAALTKGNQICGTDGVNAQIVSTDASGHVNVVNSGTFATQSTLQPNSGVDIGDVDVTSVIPGVGAANLGKSEDAVHSSGDVGVMGLGVRRDTPATTAADGDYTPLLTNDQGAVWTHEAPNVEDSGNSTTSTLGVSGVFTGTGVDLLDSGALSVMVHASHDSATDGMQFQFSSDNTNWDVTHNFTYTASEGRQFQFGVQARYFRVVYTNGTTEQTHFRVQVLLQHTPPITSIHRLVDNESPDRSSVIVKSITIAQQGGGGPGAGDFIPVQATATGNFKVSVEEFDTSLPAGTNNIGDVDVVSQIPGTGATNLGKAKDSAAGATDTGVALLAVRDDEQATITPVDGDYTNLTTDRFGTHCRPLLEQELK
jgi:hypothetical protein